MLVGKKEFATAILDSEYETYVVHVASLSSTPFTSLKSTLLDFHLSRKPQISGLIAGEAPTKVSAKYSDFADVFFSDLTSELPKHTGINNHAIKLVDGWQQSPYRFIYSPRPVDLEILKAYIETNLANGFIRSSQSPTGTPILFERKSNSFLQLYIDY